LVGALYPFQNGQQLGVRGDGAGRIPRRSKREGEIVSDRQRAQVVGTRCPLPVGQQRGETGGSASGISRFPLPIGQIEPGVQGVGMVWAEASFGFGCELLEAVEGGGALAAMTETLGCPD
jgi:hypothetical protein